MNNDIWLEKAVTSGQLQSQGGYLTPVQSTQFIKQIFDSTVLLQEVRRKTMSAPEEEIDKVMVRSRIMRVVGSENEDQSPYTKNARFEKLTLNTKKISLPWEISEDALEDNIEGAGMEQTIVDHFTAQAGLDLEDYALNGDLVSPSPSTALTAGINATVTTIPVTSTTGFPTDSNAGFLLIDSELIGYGSIDATNFLQAIRGTGPDFDSPTLAASHLIAAAVSWSPHPLIGQDDGWIKLARTGGATIVNGSSIDGGDLSKTHFFEMFRAMGIQYKRGAIKDQLRWLMSMNQFINWQEFLSSQTASEGYQVLAGREFYPLGIQPIAASAMTDSRIVLTSPKNLIFGVQRQIRIRKADADKDSIMRDMRFYNMTLRADMIIERTDAVVIDEGLTGNVA